MGVAAGYLLWSELLPDGPRAITAMEQLLRRQMGTVGRMIVTVVEEVPPSTPSTQRPEVTERSGSRLTGPKDEAMLRARHRGRDPSDEQTADTGGDGRRRHGGPVRGAPRSAERRHPAGGASR